MDRLSVKKKLYAGLGDFARQKRMEEMRRKYSAAPPAMAAQMESEDEAVERASMPTTGKAGQLKVDKMEDVNNDAFEKSMADMAEDEEMQKWMAKQRG